tara:strand:+ start:1210 stop:2262 length:1053 start_codon:yes stop_codon:yes gene_type:complete
MERAVNNTAEVEQQQQHARILHPRPQRPYNIGCQTVVVPGREMFMYAQSMQLIRNIQARGYSTVTMTCHTLERVFGYIGNLQRQNDQFIARSTKTPSNRQSNLVPRPTPPTVPAKTFTLFPKLPLEVRRIIWNLVLYTPTTISADIMIPRPFLNPIYNQPINNLRTICRESRTEAIKAQVTLNKATVGQKTFFINPTVDILWLSAWGISDDEWILVFTILHGLLAHNHLPKIAVSLELWDRLMSGNDTRSRFLNAVSAYKTEEVIILVGNTAVFRSPSLVLREPRGKPRVVLHTNFISRFRELPANVTWEELDRTLLSEIERTKSARNEVRQRMRDGEFFFHMSGLDACG